jgi:hypothetical protein
MEGHEQSVLDNKINIQRETGALISDIWNVYSSCFLAKTDGKFHQKKHIWAKFHLRN